MMTVKFNNTDNAAFCDPDDESRNDEASRAESARILRHLASKIENGSEEGGGVYDANGNRVGEWSM